MAELLSTFLEMLGPRPFVTDLHRSSIMIENINNVFPQHCQDLFLYSFYETKPMNLGLKKFVVPRESAVLGYPNEQTNYLANANHREVCKFSYQQEPNYLAVRNSIATVLYQLRQGSASQLGETGLKQQQLLRVP